MFGWKFELGIMYLKIRKTGIFYTEYEILIIFIRTGIMYIEYNELERVEGSMILLYFYVTL